MKLLFVPIWTQTISKVNKADPPAPPNIPSFRNAGMFGGTRGGVRFTHFWVKRIRGVTEKLREVTEKLREVSEKLRGE